MLGSPVIVRSEGVGVVGAIVPWNVPQFVTMSKLAPALLSGSTIVIKPSPETPLDAMLMAELLEEAGIPKGVVSVIPAGREVGEHLVRHRGVDKIAFTGSTAAGRTIASICGEQLKRVSLELGGKSAAIILDDADLGVHHGGPEVRVAHEQRPGLRRPDPHPRLAASSYDEVVDALGETVRGHDGRRPRRPRHRDRPARRRAPAGAGRQVHRPRPGGGRPRGRRRQRPARRASTRAGTSQPDRLRRRRQLDAHRPGGDLRPGARGDPLRRRRRRRAHRQRLRVRPGRLGVDRRRRPRGMDVARRVRTGTYGVNQYTMDFVAPFGGFKASGIGREFGPEGLEHYLEHKTIVP